MENCYLKQNDFESNVKHFFRELREESNYFNVTLATDDDQRIQAHRIVLSAGSKFFRKMFVNINHSSPFIYLKGIKSVDLEKIIDFLYNGETFIAHDELEKFLNTAEELQVNGIHGQYSVGRKETEETQNECPKVQLEVQPDIICEEEKVEDKDLDFGQELLLDEQIAFDEEVVVNEDSFFKEIFYKIEDELVENDELVSTKAANMISQTEEHVTSINNSNASEPNESETQYEPKGSEGITEKKNSLKLSKERKKNSNISEGVGKMQSNDGKIQRFPAVKLLDLQSNELIHKLEGLWHCKECGKKSKQKAHIREHAESHIPGAYTCHICQFISVNRKALKIHIRYNHSESLYSCSLCGKSGISKVAYNDHKLTCRY